MTRAEASKLMVMILAAWPRGQWPDETCSVYEQVLVELPFDVAQAGVLKLTRDLKFQPAIADIFAAAREVAVEYEQALDRIVAERQRAAALGVTLDDPIYHKKLARFEAAAAVLGRSKDPDAILKHEPLALPGEVKTMVKGIGRGAA